MRMLLMDREVDAKTALKELNNLPREEYRKLQQQAQAILLDQPMQEYLNRKQIQELMPLQPFPIDQALEIMDEFNLNRFNLYELPQTEWD